jgi:hypothetical protein
MERKNDMIDKPNKRVYSNGMKKPTSKERSAYASYLGSIRSAKKAEASRNNGKLGGRPKEKKTGISEGVCKEKSLDEVLLRSRAAL